MPNEFFISHDRESQEIQERDKTHFGEEHVMKCTEHPPIPPEINLCKRREKRSSKLQMNEVGLRDLRVESDESSLLLQRGFNLSLSKDAEEEEKKSIARQIFTPKQRSKLAKPPNRSPTRKRRKINHHRYTLYCQ